MEGWADEALSVAPLQRGLIEGEEPWLGPDILRTKSRTADTRRSLQSELSRMDPHRAGMLQLFARRRATLRHTRTRRMCLHHQSGGDQCRCLRGRQKMQPSAGQGAKVPQHWTIECSSFNMI